MSSKNKKTDQTDVTCLDDSLMSLEKLDRASPELWPEQTIDQVPGVNEFIAQNLSPSEQSSWSASGISTDDMAQLHQLGSLPVTSLIAEVKKLHDLAYQLGLEEAKEMTRGKYLNIFKNKEK
ncbi:DREAM core complex component lin-52 isoform X1 [Cotesia typhae]|uniref:DREAM core complex component lin-52 isoform X1 n=1 Tax=Cotesia typhae TaxID=2053667 RepID=UPI003D691446